MVENGAQVSFKTAVYVTTAVIVTLLLAFLAIYNIFVINGLNSNIQLLQEDMWQRKIRTYILQKLVKL